MIIHNSWIIGRLGYWAMMALIAIGVYGIVERVISYKDRDIKTETAITVITAIGILALFAWLAVEAR